MLHLLPVYLYWSMPSHLFHPQAKWGGAFSHRSLLLISPRRIATHRICSTKYHFCVNKCQNLKDNCTVISQCRTNWCAILKIRTKWIFGIRNYIYCLFIRRGFKAYFKNGVLHFLTVNILMQSSLIFTKFQDIILGVFWDNSNKKTNQQTNKVECYFTPERRRGWFSFLHCSLLPISLMGKATFNYLLLCYWYVLEFNIKCKA